MSVLCKNLRKLTSATPDNDSSFSEGSQLRIGNDGGGGISGIFADDVHSGYVDALNADAVKRIRIDAVVELSKIAFVVTLFAQLIVT